MNKNSIAARAALLAVLWWVLSGGAAGSWLIGTAAIGAALAVGLWLRPVLSAPISPAAVLPYLWFFLSSSLRGGLQVAVRAVRPVPDLRPALLELELRLPDEAQRLFLVSTVSLLPGTLAMGLDGALLRLHVLDERLAPLDEVRTAEAHVARLFGKELR